MIAPRVEKNRIISSENYYLYPIIIKRKQYASTLTQRTEPNVLPELDAQVRRDTTDALAEVQ